MKLFLVIVLATFSLSCFAGTKCSISFMDIGNEIIPQGTLERNNYQQISIFDVKQGDMLASLKNLNHDLERSTDEYQYIELTQVVEKAVGRELDLKVINEKELHFYFRSKEPVDLINPGPELKKTIAFLRTYKLPYCL